MASDLSFFQTEINKLIKIAIEDETRHHLLAALSNSLGAGMWDGPAEFFPCMLEWLSHGYRQQMKIHRAGPVNSDLSGIHPVVFTPKSKEPL